MAAAVGSPPPRASKPFDFDFRSPGRLKQSDPLEEVHSNSLMFVGQWRKERAVAFRLEASKGLEEIRRERQDIEDCKFDLATVTELTQVASQLRADGTAVGQVLCQSVEEAKLRTKVAEDIMNHLVDAHRENTEEAKQREAELEKNTQASSCQFEFVDSFLAMYRKRLGLAIERHGPQTVTLVFTLLDKARPDREFSLTLSLADGHGYRCLGCSPELPTLKNLLDNLNEEPYASTSLPMFMCSLRRAFIALV